VLALIVAMVGLPINHLFGYAIVALSVVLLFAGIVRARPAPWIVATLIAGLVVFAQALLAPPRIEQGHNVFLIDDEHRALAAALPEDVYRHLAAAFTARYPAERWCDRSASGCWRRGGFPRSAAAFSADGIYDPAAASRRVDAIDFANPVWLRLSFVNDNRYNWSGAGTDIQRRERNRPFWMGYDRWQLTMPWYIVHRFPAAYVGGTLCWRGELLWQRPDGRFEVRHNAETACRTLRTEDAGRQILGVAVLPDSLAMRFDPPADIRARHLVRRGLTLGGVAAVLILLLQVRARALVWPLLLIALAFIVIGVDDLSFIGGMRPFDGGDDGLFYDSVGRNILRLALNGDLPAALRGGEDVFHYGGPGLRYFRAMEKVVFGETYLGYLSLVLVMPLAVFLLWRRFLPAHWALALTLLFTAVPVGAVFGTSFFHYSALAARGFADPAAYILFVCGIVPLVGATAAGPSARFAPALGGALLLALAVIMKPIVAVAAGVLLAGAALFALHRRQWCRIFGLCLGFAPVLLMPLHNWYFGGILVLTSANATHPAVLVMPPARYLAALTDLLAGDLAAASLRRALAQIVAWLSGPSQVAALAPLGAAAVAILAHVGIWGRRFDPWLRLVAGAALAQQAVALFYIATVPRYHFLAWLLTAIVVCVWFRESGGPFLRRRWPGAWRRAASNPIAIRLSGALSALQRATGMADHPTVAPSRA
jgi:hypothetical protein